MAAPRQDVKMALYSSSPDLSSPPSDSISEPSSPSRIHNGRANINMGDEIVVDPSGPRFGLMNQPYQHQQSPYGKNQQQPAQHAEQQPAIAGPPYPEGTKLTKDGVPRKKPGRKPGTTVKPKASADGTIEPPKQRKPRKPKDPNAPPIVRKRKVADVEPEAEQSRYFSGASEAGRATELTSMRMDIDSRSSMGAQGSMAAKRAAPPGSMQSLLNEEPRATLATSRATYDPVRNSSTYDPVRETMISRDPYGTAGMGSPRAPTHMPNRASASPSIASLVDPPTSAMRSPVQGFTNNAQSRYHENNSMPPSPSNAIRSVSHTASKTATTEAIRAPPPPAKTTDSKSAKTTGMAGSGKDVTMTGTAPLPSKKVASMQQKGKGASASSSPKLISLKDVLPPVPDMPGSDNRSILDFGKAKPGEEVVVPTIVLHIPLNGETNKYVNFMRMAEDAYGWDALHPRLAANRDRKARIAAATAAIEKTASAADDGDEMNIDSGDEISDAANGKKADDTSGPDTGPVKPVRKKRVTKEDEYDIDDGWVDDSDMLWEAGAAAASEGFFVYSGPLVQEPDKPAPGYVATRKRKEPPTKPKGAASKRKASSHYQSALAFAFPLSESAENVTTMKDKANTQLSINDFFAGPANSYYLNDENAPYTTPSGSAAPFIDLTDEFPPISTEDRPKRGRGRGRGGTTRGGTGRGRGGGPGSRGGAVTRKPRMTKVMKDQMESEKLERERLAAGMTSGSTRGGLGAAGSSYNGLPGANPPFAGMVVDG